MEYFCNFNVHMNASRICYNEHSESVDLGLGLTVFIATSFWMMLTLDGGLYFECQNTEDFQGQLRTSVAAEIKKSEVLLTLEILTFQWGRQANTSFQNSMINNNTSFLQEKAMPRDREGVIYLRVAGEAIDVRKSQTMWKSDEHCQMLHI